MPFIAACILFFCPSSSFPADKQTQHTEGDQSPAVIVAPGGQSIINYYNLDPKFEQLLFDKEKELEKANKTIREQNKELEAYANKIKEISNLIAIEKAKPNGNIDLANKAESLLLAGKLNESRNVIVALTGVRVEAKAGKLTVHVGVKVNNNQCAQPVGDKKLIICIESIEHADNPSRLVVRETIEAPGKEGLKRLVVEKGTCTLYAGYYIRVPSISPESADFTISKDEPCK